MNNRSFVLQAFMESPWAILPGKLAMLNEVVARHVSGETLDAEEIQARIHGALRPPERRVNKIAVLPLFGTIFPRANLMTDMSGATSAERFSAQFAGLLSDSTIDAIVLDVDSPGGQVNGVEELSTQIFNARGTKPIVAVVNHTMASAAYWIGSAADEVVITPSGEAGSIGAFAVHEDISAALMQKGIKLSLISEGKYKTEGNPFEPLTEEARAAIQTKVREAYDAFVNAVARNRGVDPDSVRNGFGEGRMVGARQAVELGMADRVETLNETIERLLNRNGSSNASVKAADVSGDGQAPIANESQPLLAQERERLQAVQAKIFEGDSMRLRQLQQERAALVARAQELYNLAEAEARDFTEEERAEYDALLGNDETEGKIGVLDKRMDTLVSDLEKLRAAAEKKVAASDPIKPENEIKKTMKRAEYDALSPDAQSAFIRGGGKLQD